MQHRLYLSPPHLGTREQELVNEAIASNWVAPIGPMLDRFEADLATITGVPNIVALSSGTAALHLALRLSGIQAGDEVWGSTMTFIGGVGPILYLGGEPVFLDVDPVSLLLDLDMLHEELQRRRTTSRPLPKVVISTDLYGLAIDTGRMSELAGEFGFRWISDTAEAVGSRWNGAHAGLGADFVILSFNGNKIVTTSGGGALGCREKADAEQARFLSTQARDPAPHYEHSTVGYNYRLSNICAAIGVGQLEVLSDRVSARRAIHAAYRGALEPLAGITFHDEAVAGCSNRWLTTIEIDSGKAGFTVDALRRELEAHDIESRPLWKPMHLQPVFKNRQSIGGDVAARAFGRGLCLPSGSAMSAHDVGRVVDVVRELAKQ